jgi:hypothetical protein
MSAIESKRSGCRKPMDSDAKPPIEIPMTAFHLKSCSSDWPAVDDATT